MSILPDAAFACFAEDPFLAWFDSAGPLTARSRWSFLAVEPFEILRGPGIFDALVAALDRFGKPLSPTIPFTGGAAGFLGYELGAELERVPRHAAAGGMPDACIGLYDVVLAFDRDTGEAVLLSSGLPETGTVARGRRATDRTRAILARLQRGRALPDIPALAWRAQSTPAEHKSRVVRAQAFIRAGDIYQANIAAAFHADRPPGLHAADIYLALRAQNPAPYGAYLGCGPGYAVASVSPERFVGLDCSGGIEARPIKGTRPRGAGGAEDARLAAELLASGKDFSENLMIVDLLRHDIGRVAAIGSVHVPELAVLESFAHIHHLVSSIRGTLRTGATVTDLLRACFPGGSVTGAPKLRAQQIIHALEPAARGPYCGAILWAGWDGAMESSIAIRTATITPDTIIVQAGGGIVADSNPADEYEEMLVKARPLLRALGPWPR